MDATTQLLRLWAAGQKDARDALIARYLPWLQRVVSLELGPHLRAVTESADIVQNALCRILDDGPRFSAADSGDFRRFLKRVVQNEIRDQNDHWGAQRRDLMKVSGGSALIDLEAVHPASAGDPTRPIEYRELLVFALQMIDPPERDLFLRHQVENMSHEQLATWLGITAVAADGRVRRVKARVSTAIAHLMRGDLPGALAATEPDAA